MKVHTKISLAASADSDVCSQGIETKEILFSIVGHATCSVNCASVVIVRFLFLDAVAQVFLQRG